MSLQTLKQRYTDIGGRRHFLVTEVTKMQRGEVCVAAVDLQRLSIVRPLQWNHRNWPVELAERGLQAGRIISQRIRPVQNYKGYPHQTEDTQLTDTMQFGDLLAADELYDTLAPAADPSIDDIFDGQVIDGKYVVAETRCRSLGSVLVGAVTFNLHTGYGGKLRAAFVDGRIEYDLPVTELALLGTDEASPNLDSVQGKLAGTARQGKKLMIRIGLARAWDGGSGKYDPKRCYLQLNGIIAPA